MSELHDTVRALEASNAAVQARMDELEHELASLKRGRDAIRPRLSRRGLVAVGLALALLLPGVVLASHHFIDVPDSNLFHNDIDWLADYGITTGFGDGDTFQPSQPVRRQAMAAFMHRLSNQFSFVDSSVDPAGGYNTFSHYASCPGDKRVIGGGGYANYSTLVMTASYPISGSWVVFWKSEGGTLVDPSNLQVWAVCAPRF